MKEKDKNNHFYRTFNTLLFNLNRWQRNLLNFAMLFNTFLVFTEHVVIASVKLKLKGVRLHGKK
jgi:hypothetical protein